MRWSDLDSYGHVNNVKYYDYVQEARISFMSSTVGWEPEAVWMVVRQDLEYLKPIDFRTEPYEVGTAVAAIGNRSFTLAAEIRDPTVEFCLRDRSDRRGRRIPADCRAAVCPGQVGPAQVSRSPGMVPGGSSKVFTIEYAARSM